MKILVLGGAGFLGANLVRHCLSAGDNRVTVVDALDPRLRSSKDSLADVSGDIEFIQGDIRDSQPIREWVKDQDVIFHCAAQTSHTLSLSDPVFDAEVNCLGNLNLLEAVRLENQQAVVVYPSTSTVIGRAVKEVIDEDHIERPLDIYSAHKSLAEKHFQIYNNVHSLKTVVLRFANLYGPYGKPYPEFGFLNYFIDLANREQDIGVYGTGGQTRNVMFVGDAVDVLYRCAADERLYGGVYFATHDEHLTVSEIAHKIVAVFRRGQVVTTEWPDVRKRIEVDSVKFSSAQLRGLTGWAPRFSFEEGLAVCKEVMERISQQ